MTDRITPRTAIREFLDVATVSKSTNPSRSRRRRTLDATSTAGSIGGDRKRKSQSFSEVTPRTLIQGVLAATEVAPDTARKRARPTPRTKPPSSTSTKALTPGSATRSRRRVATRLDVLATPGGSNPTPRSLIQGLVNAAPVETPWQVSTVTRRTSPRNKPNFPVVTETLQSQAQGLSLSPYIKDPSSIQRPGRKLRAGLRRAGAINREQFAAGIAEKLSQEKLPENDPSEEQTSKEHSLLGATILESIHEENTDEDGKDDEISEEDEEDGPQVSSDEGEEEEKDSQGGDTILDNIDSQEQDQVSSDEGEEEEKDSQRGDTILDSIDSQEQDQVEDEKMDPENFQDQEEENLEEEEDAAGMEEDAESLENSAEEEELDAADQSTLDAAGLIETDVSAGGDAQYMSIEGGVVDEEEDDDAVVATQPARSANQYRGIDTMLLQETNAATMIQTTLDGYSPLVTPRIAAGRSHKTPALKKTPAPLRAQTTSNNARLTSKIVQPPKKVTAPRRQKKPGPELPYTLPLSLTKSIFTHFSQCRVSKEAMEAVMQGSNTFFKRISDDLAIYSSHAHRHTIEPADVELLMKRQRLINDKESLHSLIEKYLPMEYRQELIPVARSGNKVIPKI